MKKLILSSLMLCSAICKGQDYKMLTDSTVTYRSDTFPASTSLVTDMFSEWHHEIIVGKSDTIPAVMLISDTCCFYLEQSVLDLTKGLRQEGFSYTSKGYVVNIGTSDNYNEFHYWRFVKYLDAGKIPLSKNIIVWFSKVLR